MPEINLEITSIAQDGRGIGRCHDPAFPDWADMAVFARGALPGQLARIRIDKVKNNFAEGHAIGLVRDNPEFVEPFCANYGLCGGCPLQRMPYARQLEWKAVLAKDALTRQGKMDPGFVDEIFLCPNKPFYASMSGMRVTRISSRRLSDLSMISIRNPSSSRTAPFSGICPVL